MKFCLEIVHYKTLRPAENLKLLITDKLNTNKINIGKDKGKGKAIPLQAWAGPECSRRLRFPDFKTIGT
jgi:hypothetical protein